MGSGDVPTEARAVCVVSQNCENSERFRRPPRQILQGIFSLLRQRRAAPMCPAGPSQEPMSRGARFLQVGVHTSWSAQASGSGLCAEVRAKVRELRDMDSIIYLVGLIVVVMFILSLLGLH